MIIGRCRGHGDGGIVAIHETTSAGSGTISCDGGSASKPAVTSTPSSAGGLEVQDPRFTRGRRCDDGAAAVEFALVSTLLFLLLFGLIEFGIGFFTQQGAAAAAREAARRAAVGQVTTCYNGSGAQDLQAIIKQAAGSAYGQFDKPTMSMTEGTPSDGTLGDGGDTVTVTIVYHVDLPFVSAFVPGVPQTLFNLKQTGTARIEQQGSVTSCS